MGGKRAPIFQGSEHHIRRVAPSTSTVGAIEAANTSLTASAREHVLHEGPNEDEDGVILHASAYVLSDLSKDPFFILQLNASI